MTNVPVNLTPPLPFTSFDSVYSLFFAQIDDYELGAMAQEDALEFLYNQLLISISDFSYCKKDLTQIAPFQVGDIAVNFGGGNQVSIIQDLPVIDQNLDFKLYNNGEPLQENLDYTVKITHQNQVISDIVITKINTKLPDNLVVTWLFGGSFNVVLTVDEQYILALGMLASWLNHKIYREQNLRMVIGDTDYKGYSSANLLGKLMNLRDSLRLELKERRVKYSYKGFKGLS